jgi:hypothetical protein
VWFAVGSGVARFRTVAKALVSAGLVLLMTGCIKLDLDLKVSPDNKVSGTVIFAFNKQLLALTGQSPDQVIQGSGQSVPASGAPGTSVSPYEDDVFSGEKITYDNVDLDQFNRSGSADSIQVERVGDEFHVSGVLDFTNENSANNPLGDAAQGVLSSAQLDVKLIFPGAVTSSNGEIHGNSVTWSPKIGEKTEFTAVASAIGSGGSGIPTWVWVPIGVLIVAIIVAIIVTSRRRSSAVPADGTDRPMSESQPEPPPLPPTPPPV